MNSEQNRFERNTSSENVWYCARTKPKHEHIAAANLVKNLQLEIFNPRLHIKRATRRGPVRIVEPLFPCYLFIRCSSNEWNDVRYVNGISTLVHFGQITPTVPDDVIADLRACFDSEEPLPVEDPLLPGAAVTIAEGAFQGFEATILRVLPARERVQILLEFLGRPTLTEVDRRAVSLNQRNFADLMPSLAAIRNSVRGA